MLRDATNDLMEWLQGAGRKPLVLRGARQVGKTWLVRDFAEHSNRELVELNFERNPGVEKLFEGQQPQRIVSAVEAFTGKRIHLDRSLLFLDEIQAAPEVLSRLRWFAEEMPSLPIVAAGSLLDFVLADHTFSMPVGRISYLHIEPLGFEEYLTALGENGLRQAIQNVSLDEPLATPVHQRLCELLKEYLLVGGMPAVVEAWRTQHSFLRCAQIQQDLLATYRDDFAKYSGRISPQRLDRILMAVPRLLGRKFKYSNVDRDERAAALRGALDMLCKARICHRVQASTCTGIPLGAEIREKTFKVILLDVGLVSAILGLSPHVIDGPAGLELVNRGGVAEQMVGQAVRLLEPRFKEPALFYWSRDRRGSEAEVDYVIQAGVRVVPVEVKAGTTGSLKSLHVIMASRSLSLAVRFNMDQPSVTDLAVRTATGTQAAYSLVSLPAYLVGQLPRFLSAVTERRQAQGK